MTPEEKKLREEVKQSVERLQAFDLKSLPREQDLGQLNFKEAMDPAGRLVGLYKQLSLTALDDLSKQQVDNLKRQANSDYSRLEEILKFTLEQGNPQQARKNIIANFESVYNESFNVLHPLISYSATKSIDFQRLENDARAMIQSVKDQANELTKTIEKHRDDAKTILEDIRKVAAEQGVSQQAIYFRDEFDVHQGEAEKWRKSTVQLAWVLGLYALVSIGIHKIPWLEPTDTYQTIQLGVSKMLIFAVISFMLYLSTRNFLAHKHNAIVNKHRQNALMTYKALADAAKESDVRQVVLTQAAACIFGPQMTGYIRESGNDSPTAKSAIELMMKPFNDKE